MNHLNISRQVKVNKYLLFAILYFFFNSVFLPHGLLYTTILTPVFYYWTVNRGQRYLLELFLLIFLPFILIHLLIGVELFSFLVSNVLLFTTYVFAFTAHTFFDQYKRLEYIFNQILILNFGFVLLALLLFFTPLAEYVWHINPITIGVQAIPRLDLLTYEPSYYSTLLVPLVGFYVLKIMLDKNLKHKEWIAIMILTPLLLSFSIGVISTLVISLAFLLLINYNRLLLRVTILNWGTAILLSIVAILLLLLLFYPENVLYQRVYNIVTGSDPSARGRIADAFWLAWELGSRKSLWFGVGAGQLKIIGEEFIIQYYNYNPEEFPAVRIPNAFAETLVTFGIVGAVLRLGIEVFLFFKTRVFDNYFRTYMFLFVFVYQFTGSFLTNIAEYVIWALAFSSCFTQFNRKEVEKP